MLFDDEFIAALMERLDILKSGLASNGIVIIVIVGLITFTIIVQQIILSLIYGLL
jgi:hypothetical protein